MKSIKESLKSLLKSNRKGKGLKAILSRIADLI